MSKTILVITDNVRNQINGVVTTFKHVQKHAELAGYVYKTIDPSSFRSFSAPNYPDVKLAVPFNIGQKILEAQPDFIHIATEGPVGLAARCWLDRYDFKYNTSYHTKFPEFLKQLYGVPTAWTYSYLRWFHKHSGKVLVTTDTMANELRGKNFKQNLVTWSRGVDANIFNPTSRKESIGGKKVLLSVGRISKEKNLDVFCQLNIPNTVKVMVGDGPYLNALRQKYYDVTFVGAKHGVELAEYYAAADAFVFTSKADTFGIVMIESISCGTPIAAYPVPGPIDIVKHGINGAMSNKIEDAIKTCLSIDRELVYNSSRRWTWENCWNIFENNLVPAR